MRTNQSIKIGPLRKNEVADADQIVRIAFGTFLGLPNPLEFMGDRSFILPRSLSTNVTILAARENGRLIGLNVATRWGSFAFFGPLVVLPEHWNSGVAQALVKSTLQLFDKWGVRHTGLFTFAQSAKHVGLYQKFGYWPRSLTAIMTLTPANVSSEPVTLSSLSKPLREKAIQDCSKLAGKVDKGLDLTGEIESALAINAGDTILTRSGQKLDAFAICMTGPASEGGSTICYVKFAATRPGKTAGKRFDQLLQACEEFAAARGLALEAGLNLAQEDAFRRMITRSYRTAMLGVAMNSPNKPGLFRPSGHILCDLR
jgi:GNAT superfamily N-acetyltransferase